MKNPLGLIIVPTNDPGDWLSLKDDPRCVASSSYGQIWRAYYTEGENTHIRPLFVERRGAVSLIADREGNIVLQTIIRPVCPIGTYIDIPITNPEEVLGSLGSREYSCPMGYKNIMQDVDIAQTVLRESSEETSLRAEDVARIVSLGGAIKDGFHPQPIDFCALIVNRKVPLDIPAVAKLREALEQVEWVTEDQVDQLIADGILRDIQTLAAYTKYQKKRKIYPELFHG